MFCPKCGSILVPKKEGEKKVLSCSCGYRSADTQSSHFKENVKTKTSNVQVVESHHKIDVHPSMDAKCPKCGHNRAKYWTIQTRAGDEPETKFLKCEKCGHIWRDYN